MKKVLLNLEIANCKIHHVFVKIHIMNKNK